MKKNVLKSTILLFATVLSMATVSVFADDELVLQLKRQKLWIMGIMLQRI
mgnify:CR=1 FL=1